jgi:hypothetical protein
MGIRECPSWCRRHGSARCRSDPRVVGWRSGVDRYDLAVQLEQWTGRVPALSLLLPDSVLLLPEQPAVQLYEALGGLVAEAGWSGRSVPTDMHQQRHQPVPQLYERPRPDVT